MSLPAGIITVEVNFGPFMDDVGAVFGGTVTFEASTAKVWADTGTPILPRPIVITLSDLGVGTVHLPATDQPGFVNGDGDQVINWTYTVTIDLKGHPRVTRIITLPAGGSVGLVVDLDLMVDVAASPGVVVALPEVLSVNGLTGHVVIDPGAISLSTDAGNQIVYGTDGKIYVARDATKADVAALAAVATSGSWNDLLDQPAIPTAFSDLTGLVPTAALPPLAINEVFTAADQAAMLALTAQRGDMAIRTDDGKTYVLSTDSPTTLADWKQISAAGQVVSVNGKTGVVVIGISDISGLQTTVDDVTALKTNAVLGRYWTGTGGVGSWSARPSTSNPVPAFSTNDALAPPPPLPQNGDIWWRHKDAAPGPVTP